MENIPYMTGTIDTRQEAPSQGYLTDMETTELHIGGAVNLYCTLVDELSEIVLGPAPPGDPAKSVAEKVQSRFSFLSEKLRLDMESLEILNSRFNALLGKLKGDNR